MAPITISARQALIDGAASLFLEFGFDAVSMNQVRLKAGVSNGSLYHHFPTKAHLARSIYMSALKDYQEYMSVGIDAATSARDGVRALVTRHIAWVVDSPLRAIVLDRLRPFTAIDGVDPDWQSANAEPFARLKSWIALQVARGDLQKLPFDAWMAMVLGPCMQLTPRWAVQTPPYVEPRVRSALADAAWFAVRAQLPLKGTK